MVRSETIFYTIIPGKVAACFGCGYKVIGADGILCVGQRDIYNICPVFAQYLDRFHDLIFYPRIYALNKILSWQPYLESFNSFIKRPSKIRLFDLSRRAIQSVVSTNHVQQHGAVFGSSTKSAYLIQR